MKDSTKTIAKLRLLELHVVEKAPFTCTKTQVGQSLY